MSLDKTDLLFCQCYILGILLVSVHSYRSHGRDRYSLKALKEVSKTITDDVMEVTKDKKQEGFHCCINLFIFKESITDLNQNPRTVLITQSFNDEFNIETFRRFLRKDGFFYCF